MATVVRTVPSPGTGARKLGASQCRQANMHEDAAFVLGGLVYTSDKAFNYRVVGCPKCGKAYPSPRSITREIEQRLQAWHATWILHQFQQGDTIDAGGADILFSFSVLHGF